MPILCVDLIIIYQNKCLLLLRDNEPAKGQLWFPGGRIQKFEMIVDAALRKTKEETNLDGVFERIVSVEETIFPKVPPMVADVHTVNVCCLISVKEIEKLKIDNLHSNYHWASKIEESFHDAIKKPLKLVGFNY